MRFGKCLSKPPTMHRGETCDALSTVYYFVTNTKGLVQPC